VSLKGFSEMQPSEISVIINDTICFPYSEETFAVTTNTNIFTSHFTWPCSGIRTAPAQSDANAENTAWGHKSLNGDYTYGEMIHT
jgi:hypothetical protein